MKPVINIIIAIILLLCLADMPYGYYQLVRVIATCAFAYFAFDSFKSKQEGIGFVFVGLAVLFQPLIKIVLGRTLWNIVDVIVAVGLILLAAKSFFTKSDK